MTTNQTNNIDNKETNTKNESWLRRVNKNIEWFINKYLIIHPKEDK